MKARCLVIDTETGGFDASRHALLSVAAVDNEGGEAFMGLINPNPEWLVEAQALEVNGLTLEFLEKNGRPEREVLQDFKLWLGERRFALLSGCNVAFDLVFLTAAFARCGLTWPGYKLVDLQAVAWAAWERGALELPLGKDGLPRLSLDHIGASLGMHRSGRVHNALEDACMTLACLERLL